MADKQVLTLTEDNFDKEVLTSKEPVLVDFWASWCGPCRMVAPTIDALATEYAGKIKVGKVNVDEQGKLAMEYHVMTIPNILLFKDGQIVDQVAGAYPKEYFEDMLKKVL